MATTTPFYQWSVPTSSDLVKNGATDIETLGDSVDASLWNSGYGQAGKNKIINGDFYWNQRAFTSTTTNGTYMFDRFQSFQTDGTVTLTPQTFTAGTAPVAGYESKNFLRVVSTGQTLAGARAGFRQKIEDVRTFAGQTITVSFWAKASTGTPSVAIASVQSFGTGGSPSADSRKNVGKVAITSSWARYSASVAIDSLSGKTVGTTEPGSFQIELWTSAGTTFNTETNSLGIQSVTIDFWGVQAEYGSKATPFQTASGGSPQSELAMCQRYYQKLDAAGATNVANGFNDSTTVASLLIPFVNSMRTNPTALETTGSVADYLIRITGGTTVAPTAITFSTATKNTIAFSMTAASGLTGGQAVMVRYASSAGYFAWSAEL